MIWILTAGKSVWIISLSGNGGVTLNVYTHASYDRAVEQMAKILDFKADMQGKQRKYLRIKI